MRESGSFVNVELVATLTLGKKFERLGNLKAPHLEFLCDYGVLQIILTDYFGLQFCLKKNDTTLMKIGAVCVSLSPRCRTLLSVSFSVAPLGAPKQDVFL